MLAAMVVGCTQATPPAKSAADPALADPLVGSSPPEWTAESWRNSPPLKLSELRGKVVLVRWFTGTSCPYCSATAPSLRQLDKDFRDKGLVVIGMYHHKDDAPLTEAEYDSYVKTYGFAFPVAQDPDWKTLKRWWLDGHDRDFTSVSFLIDKSGHIRGVHQGGQYAPSDPAYQSMRHGIESLLAEP
jgi:peroxiredoxin